MKDAGRNWPSIHSLRQGMYVSYMETFILWAVPTHHIKEKGPQRGSRIGHNNLVSPPWLTSAMAKLIHYRSVHGKEVSLGARRRRKKCLYNR